LKFSSKDIVELVRKDIASRDNAIEALYKDEALRNTVIAYVRRYGGEESDGIDVLTFGIMTFIKQCYRPLFELKKDVNAYVFSIAKYEWLRTKKSRKLTVPDDERHDLSDGYCIEKELIDREQHQFLTNALKQLDNKCRAVLTMWANNLRMREIALNMAYKSEGMARKKKHECIGKLRLLIKGK